MKPLTKQREIEIFQPITLFLEDLEHIFSLIQEVSDIVSITNEDYSFEDIKDVLSIKTPDIHNLRFSGYKNGRSQIYLSIFPKFVYIVAEREDLELIGALEKIKEIILSRKRPLLISNKTGTFLSVISLILSGLALYLLNSFPKLIILIRGILAIAIPINLYSLANLIISKNQILLKYSKDSLSFWTSNRDKIIIDFVIGVSLLFIGYLVYLWTGYKP